MAQRLQVREPHHGVPSRALFPSPDAWDHVAPRATSSQVPRAPAKLPRPDHPPPRSPKAQRRRQAPAPRRRRCPSCRRALTRRTGASKVRVLQRDGLPHLAGGGGRGPGVALLWGWSCFWRRQRGGWRLRHSAVLSGRQNHWLWEWSTGGQPALRLCLWGLGQGAVGAAGPRGGQAGSSGGHAGVRRGCRRRGGSLRETAAPKAPDRGIAVWAPGCKFYQKARS